MHKRRYPILEFDPSKKAIIEASNFIGKVNNWEHGIICFFKDVVEKVANNTGAERIFEDKGVYGANPFYRMKYKGCPLVFFFPLIGASVSAAFLELAIGLGGRKFIACGSAGVLDKSIPRGGFVVPSAAVRDEGTSYHYLEPSREIDLNKKVIKAITTVLESHGESYRIGKVWTTDGLFRETISKIALRKKEGCLAVEMEAAALLAVAQFRKVKLGYILTGGDDVSGVEWDTRGENLRLPTREQLFWNSVEACLKL